MTHTPNMYGSNLKEYAQFILDNKQIAVSTRAEWNMLIKRLLLEEFTYLCGASILTVQFALNFLHLQILNKIHLIQCL